MRIGLMRRSGAMLALLLLALLLAQNSRYWLVALVIAMLAGGISAWSAWGLSRRIRKLEKFSHKVAGGDFQPFETSGRGDELDDLARAFNATAARLAETIRVLSDERNREATILGSMIEGVAVISARERVLYSNRAFSQILGLEG